MPTMLDVWREVSGHLEIAAALDRIAPLVSRELAFRGMVVRRVDLVRQRVETVAEWWRSADPGCAKPEHSQPLSPAAVAGLTRWATSGPAVRVCPSLSDPVVLVAGWVEWRGDLIVGLLAPEGRPQGVLVLLLASEEFTVGHAELVEALLEPVRVALANDGRLAEMERLRRALEADRRALLSQLARQDISEAVVGADAGLRSVMAQVEQVAAVDTPVLLLGEPGTGKEVVAREIHKRSPRRAGPIERINCGAIPAGLVDSELFGHERGSFTGAVSPRKGWFERSQGGTLILDEIGELPQEAQVRLLRVLQDGTFERVGGQATQHADVRVVAATHRDLREMVAKGTFREDLWFRLSVFPIEIPPLRDRPEDIPPLAAHFGWHAGRRLGRGPLTPTAADLDLLVSYAWPGNVRELAAVMERAAILGNGERLEVAAALGRSELAEAPRNSHSRTADAGVGPGRLEPLNDAVAAHIRKALAACRGRIEGEAGAAKLLGINPQTLRSKMKKLGVEWARFRSPA